MNKINEKKNSPYIARQPIFDHSVSVVSYEIFFRNSEANEFPKKTPLKNFDNFSIQNSVYTTKDLATMQILSRFLTVSDIKALTNGKNAFINFTTNLVEQKFWKDIPPSNYVFEIENDENLFSNSFANLCKEIKDCGFKIAITIKDDIIIDSSILKIADYIKVKFDLSKHLVNKNLMEQLASYNVPMIAEKIETKQDFFDAENLGFTYFQGFFFCKPEMVPTEDIPAFKINYVNVIKETLITPFNFKTIENIIRQDVSLTYKLLKYINSAYFSVRNEVTTIKSALVLLGENELKKWIMMVSLACIGKDKPDELIVTSLFRAKFCEILSADIFKNAESDDAFILGMFSLIDTFLGREMGEIIEDIAISNDVKNALLGEKNSLHAILNLAVKYEKCDWDGVYNFLVENSITNMDLANKYFESLEWAEKIYSS